MARGYEERPQSGMCPRCGTVLAIGKALGSAYHWPFKDQVDCPHRVVHVKC
jgi:hypothetical protein